MLGPEKEPERIKASRANIAVVEPILWQGTAENRKKKGRSAPKRGQPVGVGRGPLGLGVGRGQFGCRLGYMRTRARCQGSGLAAALGLAPLPAQLWLFPAKPRCI